MSRHSDVLLRVLQSSPYIVAVWWDNPDDPQELHISHTGGNINNAVILPADMQNLRVVSHAANELKILTALHTATAPANAHQACQDEPIQLGCQCQPQGANWVGTAGAPVSWQTPEGPRRWGVLSNWHVLASGHERIGRTIHQPDTARPSFAALSDWQVITPSGTNHFDAALADARIGDFHSISPDVLELGHLYPTTTRATIGLPVCKSGRTTGLTRAICTAIGAAVRVSYGSFTADFEDQDVYMPPAGPFSAPGDSGSLIVTQGSKYPVSLLFAGNDQITIANPIHYIADHFRLTFDLWPT